MRKNFLNLIAACVPKIMANILKGETGSIPFTNQKQNKDTTYHHAFLTFSLEVLASK